MSKLFIVGNGVDIAHGLKINYGYFYDYLHYGNESFKKKACKDLADGWNIKAREYFCDFEMKLEHLSDKFKMASDIFGVNIAYQQLESVNQMFSYWIQKTHNHTDLNIERIFNINLNGFVKNYVGEA